MFTFLLPGIDTVTYNTVLTCTTLNVTVPFGEVPLGGGGYFAWRGTKHTLATAVGIKSPLTRSNICRTSDNNIGFMLLRRFRFIAFIIVQSCSLLSRS